MWVSIPGLPLWFPLPFHHFLQQSKLLLSFSSASSLPPSRASPPWAVTGASGCSELQTKAEGSPGTSLECSHPAGDHYR
jgi:hypothetical protein